MGPRCVCRVARADRAGYPQRMDEMDLRKIERLLDVASPADAAAIAFAALVRVGQLGAAGAAAFRDHVEIARGEWSLLDPLRQAAAGIADMLG